MKKNYDAKMKESIAKRCLDGERVPVVALEMGVPRSTLYAWVSKMKAELAEEERLCFESKALDPREYFKQKERIAKLEGMLAVIKAASGVMDMPLAEKLRVLDEFYHDEKYSVRLMCEALEVPRGTFYNYINRGKKGDTVFARRREDLRQKILAVYYDSNQIFGAPKIAAVLKDRGEVVSKEFVRKLMREMGLESIRSGAKKQFEDETRKCQNLVKRQFKTDRPDQIWVSDVTYYRFKDKQYFICAVIDLNARKLIAYKIGYSNNTHLTKETFRMAYESRNPGPGLVFHSDQGGNYRARVFANYLSARNVTQSFSKPGVPYDNSVMETFFASMKREELYRYKYRSEREFRAAVDRYIDFYNTKRPHKTLHYKTPVQKEENYARGTIVSKD